MEDLQNQWEAHLTESGLDDQARESKLAQQQAIKTSLESLLPPQEAVLVSLSRMGCSFTLGKPTVKLQEKGRLLAFLLLLQLGLSQLPQLFGYPFTDSTAVYYALEASFLIFPMLSIYHEGKPSKSVIRFILTLVILALVVNLQFKQGKQTGTLTVLHLPFLCILLSAFLQHESSREKQLLLHLQEVGETALLAFLLACAVGTLQLVATLLFESIGLSINKRLATFVLTGILPLLPLTALALKRTVVPHTKAFTRLLSRLFLVPLDLLMLAFLVSALLGSSTMGENRNLLFTVDGLLVLVVLMIFYAQASQTPRFPIILAISSILALLVDLFALFALGTRLFAYGFSPNRAAVLGENLLLALNLAFLAFQLSRNKQTDSLMARFFLVYGVWFLIVVLIFPPLFAYR
ncbi:hypothetical protein [Sphaerochaeta sp.]|uniref:hypothetical protein n=1 Tax=Sphaerochaeta sp. TaxID=1972642 RepID=UPI002FCB0857